LGTRHSLRPLNFRGEHFLHHSGDQRRGIAESYLKMEHRHCEEQSDEAIHAPSFRGDAKHRTRNLEIPDAQLRI
jgi:hypothetical protein